MPSNDYKHCVLLTSLKISLLLSLPQIEQQKQAQFANDLDEFPRRRFGSVFMLAAGDSRDQ
jgi:hypothetical protein